MYLFFDIGGTKTRIAFSETGENFEAPIVFPTPKNFNHLAAAWKWELRKLGEEKKSPKQLGEFRECSMLKKRVLWCSLSSLIGMENQ